MAARAGRRDAAPAREPRVPGMALRRRPPVKLIKAQPDASVRAAPLAIRCFVGDRRLPVLIAEVPLGSIIGVLARTDRMPTLRTAVTRASPAGAPAVRVR